MEVSVIGLHVCQEHSSQHLAEPGRPAAERAQDEIDGPDDTRQDDPLGGELDAIPPPIFEERLHVCIDALKCLQRLARLAEQPNNIPQLSSLFPFARMARQFARAIEKQLKAVTIVLPVTATNLPAPNEQEH